MTVRNFHDKTMIKIIKIIGFRRSIFSKFLDSHMFSHAQPSSGDSPEGAGDTLETWGAGLGEHHFPYWKGHLGISNVDKEPFLSTFFLNSESTRFRGNLQVPLHSNGKIPKQWLAGSCLLNRNGRHLHSCQNNTSTIKYLTNAFIFSWIWSIPAWQGLMIQEQTNQPQLSFPYGLFNPQWTDELVICGSFNARVLKWPILRIFRYLQWKLQNLGWNLI